MDLELRRIQRDSYEACSKCQRPYTPGAAVYIGYTLGRQPAWVGDCCREHVEDLFERFEWQPRFYQVPSYAAKLWRYVDFAKFTALLRDGGLYFSRVDQLGDPFELAKGLSERRAIWEAHNLDYYRNLLRNPPPGVEWSYTDAEIEEEAQSLLGQAYQSARQQFQTIYVSCWHENDAESEALWRLYCSTGPGVALQTSFGRMLNAFRDEPDIAIGRVEYVDFRQRFANLNDAVFRKRSSLSHEREVRAVHHHFGSCSPKGIVFQVDTSVLIERVVVSPFAGSWLRDVVSETIQRYGHTFTISTSELLLEPFF